MRIQLGSVVSVILAAGDSSRMGYPKALLSWNHRTFLETLISAHKSVTGQVMVLLGKDHRRIESLHNLSDVIVAVNQNPENGPLSSLKIALERIGGASGLLLHPVDHPLVAESTIRLLVEQHKWDPSCILIPQYCSAKGHPVLFPKKFFPDLKEASLEKGAREVVRENLFACHLIPVYDKGIVRNINTREEYLQLTGFPNLVHHAQRASHPGA